MRVCKALDCHHLSWGYTRKFDVERELHGLQVRDFLRNIYVCLYSYMFGIGSLPACLDFQTEIDFWDQPFFFGQVYLYMPERIHTTQWE
jgi:hypothetical protein